MDTQIKYKSNNILQDINPLSKRCNITDNIHDYDLIEESNNLGSMSYILPSADLFDKQTVKLINYSYTNTDQTQFDGYVILFPIPTIIDSHLHDLVVVNNQFSVEYTVIIDLLLSNTALGEYNYVDMINWFNQHIAYFSDRAKSIIHNYTINGVANKKAVRLAAGYSEGRRADYLRERLVITYKYIDKLYIDMYITCKNLLDVQ